MVSPSQHSRYQEEEKQRSKCLTNSHSDNLTLNSGNDRKCKRLKIKKLQVFHGLLDKIQQNLMLGSEHCTTSRCLFLFTANYAESLVWHSKNSTMHFHMRSNCFGFR